MHLNINTDGASRGNPGHAAIGVVIKDDNFKKLAEVSDYIGITTNNVAEYKAVLTALIKAKALGAQDITLLSDSELICRQLTGKYRIKSQNILHLYKDIVSLAAHFKSFSVVHIRREQNVEADRLANAALNRQIKK